MLERDIYRERMFLKGLLLLFTAVFLGTFLWTALHRMEYPYELEWKEGLYFEAAARISEGKPMYAEPTLEWIPPPASPLYLHFCAGLMKLFGAKIALMRLVSILSTVGAGMLLYRILRETGVEDVFALIGFGIFLGAFKVSGGWYDIARPDMFALFLGMSAVTTSIIRPGRRNAVLAGIFAMLAGFARADYFLMVPFIGAHYIWRNRKLVKYYFSPAIIAAGLIITLLQAGTGEWYWEYAVEEPLSGIIDFTRLATFWTKDLWSKFPILVFLSVGGLYGLIRHFLRRQTSNTDSLMAVFTVVFLILALWKRLYMDSGSSAVIPAIPVIAGLTAWSLQHFDRNEYGLGYLLPVVFKTLAIVQMALLIYMPNSAIPKQIDAEAGKRLIDRVAVFQEPIYIPNHPMYYRLAGKQSWVDYSRLERRMGGCKSEQFEAVQNSLEQYIHDESFSIIVTDNPRFGENSAFKVKYRFYENVFGNESVFNQETGMVMRPGFVYIAK